ncbi:MAG: hypothetical protein Q7J01_01540 [Syntrophales bacterium]|nr:hypothetical protein [Syntrophales bacterium]
MDDTTKRNESEQGSEEKNPGSRGLDRDQDTRQPAALTSSNNGADGDLRETRSKNAGLSEEFFLSDLSGE